MPRSRGRGGRCRGGSGVGGRRSGTGHVHPELATPGQPAEYWAQDEADRYHQVPKAARVQAELTQSAVALGQLLPLLGPGGIVLDLGAGGGLSTVTFQALAAAAPKDDGPSTVRRGPPFTIGFDSSVAMLAAAEDLDVVSLSGIRVVGIDDGHVDVSDGVRWMAERSDRVLADMSQPLPLRRGVADAVLSVSAVQWLIQARTPDQCDTTTSNSSISENGNTCQIPSQPKLERLFASLCHCLTPSGAVTLQFYPPKGDHDFGARVLCETAAAAGFEKPEVVLDFPHGGAAKKWVFVARQKQEAPRSAQPSTSAGPTKTTPLWCALCWPVVAARCPLQAEEQIASGCTAVRRRAERQHAEVALRLLRCGRRLIQSRNSSELEASADDVNKRIKQQLHPLQFELAAALASRLEWSSEAPGENFVEQHGEISVDVGVDEEGNDEGRSNATVAERIKRPRTITETPPAPATLPNLSAGTKTELRALVESRLSDLVAVLHQAPSERWMQPPPPLGLLDTGRDYADSV